MTLEERSRAHSLGDGLVPVADGLLKLLLRLPVLRRHSESVSLLLERSHLHTQQSHLQGSQTGGCGDAAAAGRGSLRAVRGRVPGRLVSACRPGGGPSRGTEATSQAGASSPPPTATAPPPLFQGDPRNERRKLHTQQAWKHSFWKKLSKEHCQPRTWRARAWALVPLWQHPAWPGASTFTLPPVSAGNSNAEGMLPPPPSDPPPFPRPGPPRAPQPASAGDPAH